MNIISRVPYVVARSVLVVVGLAYVVSGAVAADPPNAVEREELRQAIQQARPVSDQAVSPMMQDLVSTFVSASIKLAAIETSGEVDEVGTASQERSKALSELAFHEPQNLVEFAMKAASLIEFSEDVERWSLRQLVEDANRLAEGAR